MPTSPKKSMPKKGLNAKRRPDWLDSEFPCLWIGRFCDLPRRGSAHSSPRQLFDWNDLRRHAILRRRSHRSAWNSRRTTPKAVRPYLRQFLSDPRVIEMRERSAGSSSSILPFCLFDQRSPPPNIAVFGIRSPVRPCSTIRACKRKLSSANYPITWSALVCRSAIPPSVAWSAR